VQELTGRLLTFGLGSCLRRRSARRACWQSAADIGLTIHPHPTLSESVMMAAEAYEGTITDLYMPKKA
jgi:hypothetical protein